MLMLGSVLVVLAEKIPPAKEIFVRLDGGCSTVL